MNSKHFVIIAALMIVSLLVLVNRMDAKLLEDAQSGVITIKCHMKDGARTIKSNQIVGLMDGVWVFTNGSARNCEIIEGGEL